VGASSSADQVGVSWLGGRQTEPGHVVRHREAKKLAKMLDKMTETDDNSASVLMTVSDVL